MVQAVDVGKTIELVRRLVLIFFMLTDPTRTEAQLLEQVLVDIFHFAIFKLGLDKLCFEHTHAVCHKLQ